MPWFSEPLITEFESGRNDQLTNGRTESEARAEDVTGRVLTLLDPVPVAEYANTSPKLISKACAGFTGAHTTASRRRRSS